MISKRLESIAKFVSLDNQIVDVGCDHGLLSIYLYENKLCKRIIASDVNKNALSNAIANINKKNLDIETVLSDGIESVNMDSIDTLIISGMGTSTILHILSDNTKLINVDNIILQSNNEHSRLRREMNEIGYYLEDECVVYDNKKYYVTMKFIKSNRKNALEEIEYGIVKEDNKEYYEYLINSFSDILKRIPINDIDTREELEKKIEKYKNIID